MLELRVSLQWSEHISTHFDNDRMRDGFAMY